MVYLTTYEQEKDKQKRQQEHILGRKLLNYGLQQEYALFLPEASIEKGVYGKPFLPDYPQIQFSISHCDGMAACGISDRTIGVDIERIRPFSDKVARRILAEEELQMEQDLTPETFFRYWTLKESYVKAIGTGLAHPMKEVIFRWDEEGRITGNCPGYEFYQICLEERFLLAVCIKAGKEPENEKEEIEIYEL